MHAPRTRMMWTWRVLALSACLLAAGCKWFDPPNKPNGILQNCCGGEGRCVPAGFVPEAMRSRLTADTCQHDLVCTPRALVSDPAFTPPACRALGSLEGRCLSKCLPDVSARAAQLDRSTCTTSELCVPCFDPFTGESSEACSFGADRPAEPPTVYAPCCGGQGHCIAQTTLAARRAASELDLLGGDSCESSAELCVPDRFTDTGAPLESCRAIGDSEGRCLPSCVPKVAEQAARLTQSTCAKDMACVPCFDPLTGVDTGACTVGSDAPREPAAPFARCCDNRGYCISQGTLASLWSEPDYGLLGQDSCRGAGTLCVPAALIDSEGVVASCRADGGAEGRCLPSCLPDVAAQADRLVQSTCATGALCVPCYDPLQGTDTGACRVAGDAPREAARTFDGCCSGQGRCVPGELVARVAGAADAARLGADTCNAGAMCAPDVLWQEQATLASCHVAGVLEGRCLPSCLPEIALRSAALTQGECAAGQLCAPCYDPLSGMDTGACRFRTDAPRESARTFGTCCEAEGRCVPRAVLLQSQSEADVRRLDVAAGCVSAADELCVPNAWLEGQLQPASCQALGDFEGRCLSTCLPEVRAQAERLQRGSCAQVELCVPCRDPLTGVDTGACTLGMDRPRGAAATFPSCCSDRGRCVSRETLRENVSGDLELGRLGSQGCSTDTLCVPSPWLQSGGAIAPTACRSLGGFEGRCLSDCLPEVAAQAQTLDRDVCVEGERCVPCYDPISGADTQACKLPGDAPKEPPHHFAGCCLQLGSDLGVCIPTDLISQAQAAALPQDSCRDPGTRCLPADIARRDPSKFKRCDAYRAGSLRAEPGVCIAACFTTPLQALALVRGSCDVGFECAPCSALGEPIPGCM